MRTKDRGANLLEYVGIVIIVSAVVVALGAVLLPVDSSLRRAVCQVIQVCDGDGSTQAGEGTDGTGSGDGGKNGDGSGNGGDAAGPDGGGDGGENPGPSRWDCWDWIQWGCDATKGLVDGTVDAVVGLWDGVTFLGCMVHICSQESFENTWSGIGKLFTDPGGSLKAIWDDATKPIRDRWNNGDYVGAVFYTIPAVVGTIFGGKGINKLGKLGKLDGGGGKKLPDGKKLAGDAKKAADEAEKAASKADPKAAKKAADEAEQAAKDAEQKAKDDPTPENKQAAKDARADADRAKKALKDAEVRAVMNDSALGKEANDIINKYDVKIEYRNGGGTVYDPSRNTMIIDESMTPDKASQAPYIIHEVNHAKWKNEGKSANIATQSRSDYVNNMLKEEAEGTSKQIESSKELRSKGHNTPQQPLESNYDAAYNQAIQNGKSVQEAKKAGRQAVQDAFNKGQVTTSNTHQPYPEYYGKSWDKYHGQNP